MNKKAIVKIYGKSGRGFWINICNPRGRVLANSEMYVTKQACHKAIGVLRKYGLNFKVVDNTEKRRGDLTNV